MKAVIMAGGKGTRLRPLTCNIPKPMVPIVNRPMMEHITLLLKKHNFTELFATLFYLPEAIRNYFGDGEIHGLNINYLIEETPLGTAGSVKNGEDFLDETFLVISGDTLTDIDLTAAVEFHRAKKATATLILTKVDNPLEYGVVITDGEGRIKRFLEKPGWGEVFSDTVNTGIYILSPKIFEFYKRGQVFDFSKDLFPLLMANGEPLYGYIATGYWSDIGNLEQYRQAHYDILSGKIQVSIPGNEIRPGIWAGEGVEIAPEAEINGPVLLGSYCQIKKGAKIEDFTVIGDYGTIQERTSIKRGILWNHCYLGEDTEIRGAILCRNSYLKGKNSVYEGAVLGEGVSLGTRATIKPQVKIWPEKIIDSGVILNESLIWAKKSLRSLFGNSRIIGTVNREITPEFVVKLGAVFGAHLKPGAQMVVSSDNFRAARIFKRAFVAGALSTGVGVYDLGTMATPMTRYALVSLGAKGGAHLRINLENPEGIQIEFFDHLGINIDKNTERALENAFFSEDFPRVNVNSMGELTFVPKLLEPYLSGLLSPDIKEIISGARFKIITAYDRGSIALILPSLLEEISCQAVNVDSFNDMAQVRPRTIKELMGALSAVMEKIKENKADLGVVVDNNAERLILLDENGEILKEEQLTALISFLVLKYKPERELPVQVTAPHYIEKMAKEFHGRVIRTKVNPRSIMERSIQTKLFPTSDGKSSYLPQFDAMFCLVKVLELLAREKISLATAKTMITGAERGYREVNCPWEEKGRVMRNLFDENKERPVEMTDGLKVFHDEGWALVLPDAEEPIFRIYAEADTVEEADALTNLYMSRINEMLV